MFYNVLSCLKCICVVFISPHSLWGILIWAKHGEAPKFPVLGVDLAGLLQLESNGIGFCELRVGLHKETSSTETEQKTLIYFTFSKFHMVFTFEIEPIKTCLWISWRLGAKSWQRQVLHVYREIFSYWPWKGSAPDLSWAPWRKAATQPWPRELKNDSVGNSLHLGHFQLQEVHPTPL